MPFFHYGSKPWEELCKSIFRFLHLKMRRLVRELSPNWPISHWLSLRSTSGVPLYTLPCYHSFSLEIGKYDTFLLCSIRSWFLLASTQSDKSTKYLLNSNSINYQIFRTFRLRTLNFRQKIDISDDSQKIFWIQIFSKFTSFFPNYGTFV